MTWIVVSVKDALLNSESEEGRRPEGRQLHQIPQWSRTDGSYIRFDTNSAVLINPQLEPIGTRVYLPTCRQRASREEIHAKIISLAGPEVL